MRNLCLTCKQFHEITVRYLYNEVTLDLGSPLDNRLGSMLNPRNIGLPYIRKLDLYLASVLDACNQVQQAMFACRILLELLPENILEKFSWHPWATFSMDNLQLLYRKQKRLQWLEGIALDRDPMPELEKMQNVESIFSETRRLGLYPDNREVLNFCGWLLKNSPKVEKITLHTNFDDELGEPTIPYRELNDTAAGPGLVTRTIFGHMAPFTNCKPMALKDLCLQKVNLRYAADTYCRVIDFTTIKSLKIFLCSGADTLFAEMSKSSKLPEKLEILEFKHDDNAEGDAMTALDAFLPLVTGIKELTLDIWKSKVLPSPSGITRHGKTLLALNVHGGGESCEDDELVYDLEHFQQICKGCPNLEQLSAAFPTTSLIRSSSEDFDAFQVGEFDQRHPTQSKHVQAALGDLPNLVTLNITTWPNNSPSSSRLPRKVYDHLLQGMAQQGFERSISHAKSNDRSSKLNIIAFGASDKVCDREDSSKIVIFVKGKRVDPLGQEGVVAIQMSWVLRRYVEPRSSVLDFLLSRTPWPPARSPPSSVDSD
jgi:hypothetical protein